MLRHWKSTIAGVVLGGIQAVVAVSDWDLLSTRQLCLRFSVAAASVLLGILAKDS
jgi:hypothetical protein